MRDTTNCPECGESALVRWRAVLESTDGPIEHAKVECGLGHWFLLPVAMLDDHRQRQRARPSTVGQMTSTRPAVAGRTAETN